MWLLSPCQEIFLYYNCMKICRRALSWKPSQSSAYGEGRKDVHVKWSQLLDQVLQHREIESCKDSMIDKMSERQDSLRLDISVIVLSLQRHDGMRYRNNSLDAADCHIDHLLNAQKRPQAEIESVEGQDYSPLWSDRVQLPCVVIPMKEISAGVQFFHSTEWRRISSKAVLKAQPLAATTGALANTLWDFPQLLLPECCSGQSYLASHRPSTRTVIDIPTASALPKHPSLEDKNPLCLGIAKLQYVLEFLPQNRAVWRKKAGQTEIGVSAMAGFYISAGKWKRGTTGEGTERDDFHGA